VRIYAQPLPCEDSNSTLSSLDFSTNMTTSDWKNWYNSTDVVSGTTMLYFSSSVNSVANSSNLSRGLLAICYDIYSDNDGEDLRLLSSLQLEKTV